ncbi:MAG TPA: SRPBCC family protein [Blastococcus sp.]|jgi:hypothetical protein|nr:SRPBCC family protein [Blastococcus sp.]
MSTTTATGSRDVPQDPEEVWRALAVLEPYCSVCDVSYLFEGAPGGPRLGTTFVCAPGRLDGTPAAGAPRGEIVEWDPPRLVATRLRLTPETWTTRIELRAAPAGGTRVTMTVTHEPAGGGRLVRRLQRSGLRRLVQRTVDAELAKVPAHVDRVARSA